MKTIRKPITNTGAQIDLASSCLGGNREAKSVPPFPPFGPTKVSSWRHFSISNIMFVCFYLCLLRFVLCLVLVHNRIDIIVYWYFDVLAPFWRHVDEHLSNIYRTSIEHLSTFYRTSVPPNPIARPFNTRGDRHVDALTFQTLQTSQTSPQGGG